MPKIKDCSKCGERGLFVSCDGKCLIRPERFSKCKNYVAPAKRRIGQYGDGVCRTEVLTSKSEVIKEWNKNQNGIN